MSVPVAETARGFAVRAAVAVAVVVGVLLAALGPAAEGRPGLGPGAAPAAAQVGAPGLVAERWGPVEVGPDDPPEVAVSDLWIEPGTVVEGSSASVVVALASADGLAAPSWRVSVSVGDPFGARTRASAVSVDQAVSGVVEHVDGDRSDEVGATTVVVGDDGRVTVEVPIDQVEANAVLWADVEASIEDGTVTSSSPWFDLVDLLGAVPGPVLGVAEVAEVVGDRDVGPVALPGPGPTVSVVGRGLEVTTTQAAPVEVDGVEVLAVTDTVVVARDGALAERVEIDRATGEVRLVSRAGTPTVAEPGVSPWLVSGPAPTDPGAPSTITFDIEALDVALGGPVLERATTAVGVTRTVGLADGRSLRAAAVVGTMAWFDSALSGAAPDADREAGAVREAPTATTVLVVAVVVLVVVLAAVVVLVRRRVRGRADGEAAPTAGDGAPADPLGALFAEVDELSARVDRLADGDGDSDRPYDPDPAGQPGPDGPPGPGAGGGARPDR